METDIPENLFIRRLAERHRVLLLGGMAVIAHGRSRHTKDFDIWLEPFGSPEEWGANLACALEEFPESWLWSLARRRRIGPEEAPGEIAEYGVVRVNGFALPVDVFRQPSEFDAEDFEQVWKGSLRLDDSIGLPDEADLYLSKINTGRESDHDDIAFLESKIKSRLRARLPVCDLAEAASLLERFVDPTVLDAARTNPHPEVRRLCHQYLREFAAEGDPYSREILEGWKEEE
jgi:hypothetical protein